MLKMYKDGKVCKVAQDQVNDMKKAGWSLEISEAKPEIKDEGNEGSGGEKPGDTEKEASKPAAKVKK